MRCKIALYFLAVAFAIAEGYIADEPRNLKRPRSLPQSNITSLAQLTNYEEFYGKILRPIMKVRVPQTESHDQVRKFIVKQFQNLNWSVDEDVFEEMTPYGMKKFQNIIATFNPMAKTRHVMAAHYDSKYYSDNNGREFIGAIDSAVPCAMLVELARTVTPFFQAKSPNNEVTLEMVFFDGEEAFKEWSKNDSIYGARHLANTWMSKADPLAPKTFFPYTTPTLIDSMESLILLDLLGAPNPAFYNMHESTSHLFQQLRMKEIALSSAGKLQEYNQNKRYFKSVGVTQMYIEDDHIPFLQAGVPILHLIPVPFPGCWHKFSDNESCLNNATIHNLIKIFRVFTVELFDL